MASTRSAQIPATCQLVQSEKIGRESMVMWFKRRCRNVGRRVRRLLRGNERPVSLAEAEPRPEPQSVAECHVGDRVRVRTVAEITATLDVHGRLNGCTFLEPMAQFCGREFQVARCVRHFFDEARWRMVRCRHVVLLEGAHCDGSGHPDTQGCDRMCFFFWRTEWLERAGES
jgi:hypothetical protein